MVFGTLKHTIHPAKNIIFISISSTQYFIAKKKFKYILRNDQGFLLSFYLVHPLDNKVDFIYQKNMNATNGILKR